MKSGKTVEFDTLVLAVGVRANTTLVKDIGGEVNRGILVNDRMETSLESIYAAGDCTEGNDISLGQKGFSLFCQMPICRGILPV